MERLSPGLSLRARRKALGLTQFELAYLVGVHEKSVSRWERDLSYPSSRGTLLRLRTIPEVNRTL